MSLARAFTQRLRGERSPRIKHSQISLPIQLTHTSNDALSHNSPDVSTLKLRGYLTALDTPLYSRMNSPEPFDSSDAELSTPSVETPHLTDASSIDSSMLDEKLDSERYFPYASAPADDAVAEVVIEADEAQALAPPPALPKRAPSHSKREHERLARKRSVRSSAPTCASPAANSQPATISETSEGTAEDTIDDASTAAANLDSVHEELAVPAAARTADFLEDSLYLMTKGLAQCDASEYIVEIDILREAFGFVAL